MTASVLKQDSNTVFGSNKLKIDAFAVYVGSDSCSATT